jgi:hypothetical protein
VFASCGARGGYWLLAFEPAPRLCPHVRACKPR